MSEKTRIAVIFGIVALVAGGGLFYFFKIYTPNQQRAAAQAEIATWEARWDAARSCLLGPTPASGKGGEALAVREMSPDPWDRGTCTQLIGKLSRGIADDTGLMPVEHAWMSIDRAAAKVATSFATHVDPFGESADQRGKESPLPAALDALDAAHAALREAAGMSPPAMAARAALPAAELLPLTLGATPVRVLSDWMLPQASGVIGFGDTTGGAVQLALAPGKAPRIVRIPPGVLRAVPDLSWGAVGLYAEVAIAPVDEQGAFGARTSFPVTNGAQVVLAVGAQTDGLVAFAHDNQLSFARAQGGPLTLDQPLDVDRIAFALDLSGRGLAAWSTADGAMFGTIASTGAAPKVVELGSGEPAKACLGTHRGWVWQRDQLVGFDDRGAVPHMLPDHELIGCHGDAALLVEYHSSHYAACTDTCRVVDITNLRPTRVATIVNGKVHAMSARDHVLGVWRENAPPRFFATKTRLTPILATTDGEVIDVLATTDDGVVIARLPAT